jgi:hypothetical protein
MESLGAEQNSNTGAWTLPTMTEMKKTTNQPPLF